MMAWGERAKKELIALSDYVGFLAGVIAIALLFLSEYYVIGTVFAGIVFIIAGYLVYQRFFNRPDVENLEVNWTINLEDDSGEKATVKKEREIRCWQNRKRAIVDRHLACSGEFGEIRSGLGETVERDWGGADLRVYTYLKDPLSKGDQETHTLDVEMLDTFVRDTESFKHYARTEAPVTITVNFPDNRTPEECRAYLIDESDVQPLSEEDIALVHEDSLVRLEVDDPSRGNHYLLEWDW